MPMEMCPRAPVEFRRMPEIGSPSPGEARRRQFAQFAKLARVLERECEGGGKKEDPGRARAGQMGEGGTS